MGSELCTSSPECEVQLDEKNMINKFNSYEVQVSKPKKSSNNLTGMCQIYSKGLNKTLIYKGQIRNSKFHGFGQFFQNEKLIYEGEFINGNFQGWGTTENYTGQFRQGHYDGYGIFQLFQNSDKQIVTFYYEGYFSRGKFSGDGIQIKNAKIPIILIEKAHNNQGMIDQIELSIQNANSIFSKKYQVQQIYVGHFANGQRNGFGRLFKNNKQFSGTFINGKTMAHGSILNFQEEKQRKKNQKLNKSCMKC